MFVKSKIKIERSLKAIESYLPNGVVAIDLETTGLSPLMDHIIEVAAIKVRKGKTSVFQTLIKPPCNIPEETIKFHGITDKDVENSPKISDVLPKLISFLEDLPIIAHNAKFDSGFLTFALHKNELKSPNCPVYCTVKAARKVIKDVENYKLSHLSKALNIPLENHHRAFDDTLACLYLFNHILEKVKEDSKTEKAMFSESLLFNISDFTKSKTMHLPEHLIELKQCAQKQHVVFIKYRGGSYKGKLRPIRPVSLLPMPEGNVIYAHCLLTDLYKTFAIRKVSELKKANAQEIKQVLDKLELTRKKG